jgi:hypothetical protein
VVHAQQPGELDRNPYLLQAFTHRRTGGILVVIDEATRQAPEAITRLDRAASEHDAAVGLDHDGGRDLWVVPQHETVVRTRFNLAAFDDRGHQRRAAVDAEVSL